jgi:hypothetical protein
MLRYSVGAEALQEVGRDGAFRIRRWLEHTARFRISHTAYDLDDAGNPYTQVRVELLDGSFENFDLVGDILGPDARAGNRVYVECKTYTSDGNQGTLYDEYLAVAYSAFAREYAALDHPPSVEFMWVTTHPFALGRFARLTTEPCIGAACRHERFESRLGGSDYNPELGQVLASRLWLCVVNDRMLEEMLMGPELRKAVMSAMVDLTGV